jgi:hypothetical protein
MPSNQFIRAEALPHFDIDAVAIRDAKQPLRAAHDGADALVLRVGQLDAGYGTRIGTGNTSHISGVLGIIKVLTKAAIPGGGRYGDESAEDWSDERGRSDRKWGCRRRGWSTG